MLKLKMMLCVMMLPLVVVGCTRKTVCQCVKPPPAWTMQLPDWQTPLSRIISPSEDGLQKQLEGTQRILMTVQIELPISMGNSCNIVKQLHALPAEYKCLK